MFEQVKRILVDVIHVDEAIVSLEASLKEDLDIDSLAAVELALELESVFGVRIEDEELAKLETVGDVVNILEKKLNS
ncbi:MAG: acyl carrier protein [Erysipelotrichaceae bacterium]|nr:acyl carrier protein [Erysipelotrichaceae bacterium]